MKRFISIGFALHDGLDFSVDLVDKDPEGFRYGMVEVMFLCFQLEFSWHLVPNEDIFK